MTVNEAVDHVAKHGTLEHVRIVDMRVSCGRSVAGAKDAYSEGFDAGDGPSTERILVSHHSGPSCEALAEDGVGTLHPLWPKVRKRLEMGPDDRAAILRAQSSVAWALMLALALLGIGAYGIVSGRRAKRGGASPMPTGLPRVDGNLSFPVVPGERLLTRPLRPDETWFRKQRGQRMTLGALGGAALLAAVVWIIGFSIGVVERLEVWNEGAEPVEVKFSAERESEDFVFITTDLAAEFVDAEGQTRQVDTSYFALGFGKSRIVELGLRYDPEDPTRVVFSEEVDDVWGRLAWMLTWITLLSIVGFSGVGQCLKTLGELDEKRRVVVDGGEEILLEVVFEQPTMHRDEVTAVTYGLRLPSGMIIEDERRPRDPPFLIDGGKNLVLGLRHPERGTFVVLGAHLEPLDVDGAETKRVRSRYRQERHGSS